MLYTARGRQSGRKRRQQHRRSWNPLAVCRHGDPHLRDLSGPGPSPGPGVKPAGGTGREGGRGHGEPPFLRPEHFYLCPSARSPHKDPAPGQGPGPSPAKPFLPLPTPECAPSMHFSFCLRDSASSRHSSCASLECQVPPHRGWVLGAFPGLGVALAQPRAGEGATARPSLSRPALQAAPSAGKLTPSWR